MIHRTQAAWEVLNAGDMIQIADRHFRFAGSGARDAGPGETALAERTIADVQSRNVVLLVSDIHS